MADEYIKRILAKAEFTGNFRDEYPTALIHALIDSVPAADVQPVRHGRWKPGDMPTYGGFKCSLCKKNTIVYKPPYCPNCGAKMDGGKENE